MADTVVDKARLRLEAIEREANELRQFIRMYERLAGDTDATGPRPADISVDTSASQPEIDQEFSTKEEIVDAARAVLKEVAPAPMHISELFDRVLAMDIRIPGKNPKGNLSAKLAPPDDLVYVRKEGWYYWPKNEGLSLVHDRP